MNPLLLILVAALSGLLPLFSRGSAWTHRLALIGATGVFMACLALAVPVLLGSPDMFGGAIWYMDSFAALLVLIIGFVQWTAIMMSWVHLTEEVRAGVTQASQIPWYYCLVGFFVLSMLACVMANNLGLMWVALEATTLATTLLVAFYAKRGSLEAAWKYVLICSVGLSLGLLGLLFVFYAAAAGSGEGLANINWTDLRALGSALPAGIMQIAFAFIIVGFGTKVGLVPMHTWLPDAHGHTPSPVSGMLSGVLLNTALFVILRYKSLADASLGNGEWTNNFLLAFGALSFAVSAAFILIQKNYKRLLAYSSIEHMGFTTFAFGLGPVGSVLGIIHLVGHALAKSMLFFASGNILLRFKTTDISRVGNVMKVLPYTGAFFLIGILMLLAVPPSPLFVSEYGVVASAILAHPWYVALILIAGTVVVAGFTRLLIPLLFAGDSEAEKGERLNLSHFAMAFHVVLLVLLGAFSMTPEGYAFISQIASSII